MWNNFKLAFENPLYLLLLIPAFAVILLPFLRFPKKRRYTFKRMAPVVLHLIIATLLVCNIAGISVSVRSSDQTVLILMDASDSMSDVLSEAEEKTEALLSALPEDAKVGVIVFGNQETLLLDPKSDSRTCRFLEVDGGETEISAALEYASSFFSDDGTRRIILLSDGKETVGNAESMASYLAAGGIEVDVMNFDTDITEKEMQLESVSAESSCYAGDDIEFVVEVESNYSEEIVLTLYDNGEAVTETPVQVQEGTNLFTVHTTVAEAGTHGFCVELTALYDTVSENNKGYAAVTVNGAEAILLVSGTLAESESLAGLLTAAGADVSTVTTQNLSKSIIELCSYDEIVLLNVDGADLPRGADDLLEEYVSLYGRTLLAVGGSDTFQYGNMSGTAFEELLPVQMELKETEEGNSVALMLVLDCSMSMSQNSTNLSLAKQGAVKVVESMSDQDEIGIISFNSTAVLQAGLTKATAGNKEELTRVVSALGTRQGTYYTQALQMAYEELLKAEATTRHVIFLSDGNPNDRGYDQVVQNMAEAGITVSTIGLGYTSSILENMAATGNGRYYYVSSTKDLPDIMLSETEQVVVNAVIEKETPVKVVKETEVTEGLTEENIPALQGYIGLTEKEEATVLLATEEDRPILSYWKYGNGTVAVFAGDLSGDWSAAWYTNLIGKMLINRICTGFIELSDAASSMQADIEVNGTTVTFTVQTATQKEGDRVYVTLMTEAGEKNLELLSTGENFYSASTELGEEGIHSLIFLQKNEADENVDFLITSMAISYSTEYDAFRQDGETVLRHLAELTGGVVTDSVKTLAERETREIYVSKNPAFAFCMIGMLLLLLDIAIRKLRLRDFKRK